MGLRKHLPHLAGHGFLLGALAVGLITLTFNGEIAGLLAAATSSLNEPGATAFFTPYGDTELVAGDITDIDVNMNARTPVNAIGVTIRYPHDTLEIVGISKKRSFLDLWTEDTIIKEDAGEIHFSGGTTVVGGLTGTGTIMTVSVKAKKAGEAALAFKELQVFASDGNGTELDTRTRTLTYRIAPSPADMPTLAGGSATVTPGPQPRSADLDGNGRVTLVDLSILTVHVVMPYNARYDLDADGSVALSDISILFAQMR